MFSKSHSDGKPAAARVASASASQDAQGSLLPAEERKHRADYSHALMQAFGAIVAVLMRSKAHRQMSLADIEGIVGPAVVRNQYLLAELPDTQSGLVSPVGVVLWARVSPKIDERIVRDLEHPVKLAPAEWDSGEIVWIVDAIGTPPAINKLMKQLKETSWKGRAVKMRVRDKDNAAIVREIA